MKKSNIKLSLNKKVIKKLESERLPLESTKQVAGGSTGSHFTPYLSAIC